MVQRQFQAKLYQANNNIVFFCAVQEVFLDPVFAADGFTYERRAIEDWISRKAISPMTNLPLPHRFLTPNVTMRNLIQDMRESGATLDF